MSKKIVQIAMKQKLIQRIDQFLIDLNEVDVDQLTGMLPALGSGRRFVNILQEIIDFQAVRAS